MTTFRISPSGRMDFPGAKILSIGSKLDAYSAGFAPMEYSGFE